jgi:hypothetical protein
VPADNPFARYDKIRKERKPIEKEIDGEKFSFPGSCPADVAVEFVNLVTNTDVGASAAAVMYLTKLIDEEQGKRLWSVTTVDELSAIAVGLFEHYGLIQDGESPRPNRATRRASSRKKSTSRKNSSSGSARSGRTSGGS